MEQSRPYFHAYRNKSPFLFSPIFQPCLYFRGILKAAQTVSKWTNGTGQKFFFLASDGWGKQSQVVKGIEDFAVGAITVELESKKMTGE